MENSIFTAENVLQNARSFLGMRWRHRGRGVDGIDCVGLVIESLLRAGWQPKQNDALRLEYSRRASDETLTEILLGEGEKISPHLALLRPADVLLFRFEGDDFPNHVGLVTDIGKYHHADGGPIYFIHSKAAQPNPRVVEGPLADGWLQSLVSAFRVPSLVDKGGF